MATSPLVSILSFLAALGVFHKQPMKLFYDNQAAIQIAKNHVFHEHTNHIEIDCHFVCERLEAGILEFPHVGANHQPPSIFTKRLGRSSFSI